jgi:putative Mg2+ transporter-C (MgtC) family protein
MVDIHLPGFWSTLFRLSMALVFCGAVGIEREIHLGGRVAGLRTHVLVGVGSCLYMLVSLAVGGTDHDPGRVAAQVVTGIGFIGAGTIIRHRDNVHGLTTAASVWAAAAIGLAAGIGWFAGALLTSLLVIGTLWGLRNVSHGPNPRFHPPVEDEETEEDRLAAEN